MGKENHTPMNDNTYELVERIATLTADNTELLAILYSFMENAPQEQPSLINVRANLAQARSYWSWGRVAKIRLELIKASIMKGDVSVLN